MITAAQTTAPERITELMREHFGSAVFIFEAEAEEDTHLQNISYRTSGSFTSSLGLVEYVKNKMLQPEYE